MCTYWNSLGAPFIWDDQTAIVTNPTIQRLWPLSDPLTPPRETPVAGRPLVNLSFAVNYAFGGLNVDGLSRRQHRDPHRLRAPALRHRPPDAVRSAHPERVAAPRRTSTALVVALLWLVHPLQSEVVDYVTQRSESLMALFFLLTCTARFEPGNAGRDASQPPGLRHRREARWQTLSVVACACGMASKESMVVAPVAVVLYDWAFEFDSLGAAWRRRTYLYAGLAATWIVLAALIWNTPRSTVGSTVTIGPWIYLLNQTELIGRYLWLSLWPSALVLDYGLPRPLALRDVLAGGSRVDGVARRHRRGARPLAEDWLPRRRVLSDARADLEHHPDPQ